MTRIERPEIVYCRDAQSACCPICGKPFTPNKHRKALEKISTDGEPEIAICDPGHTIGCAKCDIWILPADVAEGRFLGDDPRPGTTIYTDGQTVDRPELPTRKLLT